MTGGSQGGGRGDDPARGGPGEHRRGGESATGGLAERAARALLEVLPSIPRTAVVVGSGLAALEDALTDPVVVPFGDLPGLPGTGVSGHGGRFVHGRLGPTEVLIQSGRFHVYEGHPLEVVVAPTRIVAGLGVETVLVTNAAGGIRPSLEPGDVILVDDVVNLMFRSPLAGPVVGDEPRFPHMSEPLDRELGELLRAVAADLGIRLEEGVYAAVTGPAYETAAEIRMLSRLGADVVGMSTVPEVVTAAAVGLRCAVLSLVTNKATGLSDVALSHEDVLEVGRAAGDRVKRLVEATVARLAAPGSGGGAGRDGGGGVGGGGVGGGEGAGGGEGGGGQGEGGGGVGGGEGGGGQGEGGGGQGEDGGGRRGGASGRARQSGEAK